MGRLALSERRACYAALERNELLKGRLAQRYDVWTDAAWDAVAPPCASRRNVFVNFHKRCDDDGAPLPQLLARAEDAYGVYGVEDALVGLYAPADDAEPPLEAYLFSQAVGTSLLRGGRDAPWQRRYFVVDGETLSAAKDAPGALERVVHSVLARELSEEDVACLLYTSPSPRD